MQAILTVKLTPRSSRNAIERIEDGVLIMRVTAPPVGGAANRAVCEIIAESLRIPKSRVKIRSGAASRTKTVEIDDLATHDALERLSRNPAND